MTSMRSDARRAIVARRERSSSAPARIAAPAVTTLAVVAVTATVLVLLGTPLLTVLAAVVTIVLVASVAARRTVASLSAGLSLWLIRPYQPGERVRLYSPDSAAVVEAEVVRIGLLNTTLAASTGLFVVANTRMLRAAPECRR